MPYIVKSQKLSKDISVPDKETAESTARQLSQDKRFPNAQVLSGRALVAVYNNGIKRFGK